MISAVINTFNAGKTIERTLKSLKTWAGEIVIVDMHSDDNTLEICRKYTDKIFFFDRIGYADPARNFAIGKAAGPFIYIIDADEETPPKLSERLKSLTQSDKNFDFIRIPMITNFLGRWMKGKMFWPDYHVRFFRKGKVVWKDQVHSFPETTGQELVIEPDETLAMRHYFCGRISDFLKRIDTYTDKEADSLMKNNPRLGWNGLIRAPIKEFTKRFFKFEGYTDGVYGLIHSILMAFYGFVSYAKAYEKQGFAVKESTFDTKIFFNKTVDELRKCFYYFIASISRVGGKTIKHKIVYLIANILKKL